MRYFMLSACLLTVLAACPARAEGGAGQALTYTWTGLYGGVNAGYGMQNSDWDFAGGGSTSPEDNSGVVGLQVGYDAALNNNLFVGLEASIDATAIDGKTTCFTSTCETHLSSLGDLSLRAGISQDRTLFYLKGGVAYEDATHHIEGPDYDNHDNGGAVFGYLIGGGAEYALLYNITTKLEYDYMDFGSNGYTINPDTHISVKESVNLVKLGFNFKFD